ncbi:MAG: SMC-Scp complex subunit ScpB, partial [Nitrospiria bacterium]
AYKQPLTRPEIEAIRGVDAAGVVKTLMDRRLIKIVGRKDLPGRPMMFGTTKEFLTAFGLNDLADLPTLRDFAEIARSHDSSDVNDEDSSESVPPMTPVPVDELPSDVEVFDDQVTVALDESSPSDPSPLSG